MSTTSEPCRGWRDPVSGATVECAAGGTAERLALDLMGSRFDVHGMCDACRALSAEADLEHRLAKFDDELVRRSDVGDRLRRLDLSTYPRGGHHDAARAVAESWFAAYVAGAATNLFLWGDAGRGKSGLAWGLARRAVEDLVSRDEEVERLPAVFVNFRYLLARIKEGWDTGERTEHVSAYFGVRLLVLDDVGAERPTQFNRDELLGLIDARYERRLPTIFTSNWKLPHLGERLAGPGGLDDVDGRRIVSRIAADVVTHEIGGDDLRLRRG